MKLALLGEESLDDIFDYLIHNLEEPNRQIFLTERIIREYCMYIESDTYFSYSFHFDIGNNSPRVIDCSFFKSSYYEYNKMKYRRKKLEKIISRSKKNKFRKIIGL